LVHAHYRMKLRFLLSGHGLLDEVTADVEQVARMRFDQRAVSVQPSTPVRQAAPPLPYDEHANPPPPPYGELPDLVRRRRGVHARRLSPAGIHVTGIYHERIGPSSRLHALRKFHLPSKKRIRGKKSLTSHLIEFLSTKPHLQPTNTPNRQHQNHATET
jgi:hypothetical protein